MVALPLMAFDLLVMGPSFSGAPTAAIVVGLCFL